MIEWLGNHPYFTLACIAIPILYCMFGWVPSAIVRWKHKRRWSLK